MSLRNTKKFTDLSGNEIFTIKNKILAMSKSFRGESPHGYNFDVKGHIKLLGSRSTVEFKNASDGSHVELEVIGSWLNRKAEISLGGRPVAIVQREIFNMRDVFANAQTVSGFLQETSSLFIRTITG